MKKSETCFRSTYRLQLHKEFQFRQVAALLEYFNSLGISHLYLSPILEARPQSLHGYDGINPEKISSERGGEDQLYAMLNKIKKHRSKTNSLRGAILDIVPNHLATHHNNPAWWSVLQKGKNSPYWDTFDIRGEKVWCPILATTVAKSIESNHLILSSHPELGYVLKYFETTLPLNEVSQKKLSRRKLKPSNEIEPDFMNEILADQYYVLKDWRSAIENSNYRRFFDVNELVGLKIENKNVFDWYHKKIFKFLEHPAVQGLRIDHIDGLLRPKEYLGRLKKHVDSIWVEKILSDDEVLPYDWPVEGTTGYDFSSKVTQIFVDANGYKKIHDTYLSNIDSTWPFFSDCIYQSKKFILHTHFKMNLSDIAQEIHKSEMSSKKHFSFSHEEILQGLIEITICLKVYRLYFQNDEDGQGLGSGDRRWLMEACDEAKIRSQSNMDCLDWLFYYLSQNSSNSSHKKHLLGRWQQLTGPVMAKGFEDTALYRYVPLISLNTIGGQPDWNYSTVMEFHSFVQERHQSHPLSMNSTTTHDTKRNEDVRSRIHVLSEIPEHWLRTFSRWRMTNSSQLPAHLEYFIYQTLIGVFQGKKPITTSLKSRMKEYFLKAVREAKLETSWIEINVAYEQNLIQFIDKILTSKKSELFLRELRKLSDFTEFYGAFNSLSELALRILSPGIPDTFQGTELWSYFLVDPDNRRPVDYEKLCRLMKKAKEREAAGQPPISNSQKTQWRSGEIKFAILRELLKIRNQDPILFEKGKYIPLLIEGPRLKNVIGFARMIENRWVLLVAPRFLASSMPKQIRTDTLEIPNRFWKKTELYLPLMAPLKWHNPLTLNDVKVDASLKIDLGDVFQSLPIGVLVSSTHI
jgi:(1->4)-alpha-D-glucan 1-alpha-D-glucosylmutase